MTTTRSEFRNYIDAHAALPPDCVLGYIIWSTISDGAYSAAKIEEAFNRLGLNPKFSPGEINPVNAWEKATKEVHGHKYAVTMGGQALTAELMTRDVERTGAQVHRHLVREVKDSSARRLLYGTVAEFVFYKPAARNGVVDHSSATHRESIPVTVDPAERPTIQSKIDIVAAAYDRYANYHDGQRVRAIVRNYLLYLNGIQMKNSVYFVHASRANELTALQEFTNGLPGCSFAMLPLPDLPHLRHEVIDAFQREAVEAFTNIVTDIQRLRETRKGKPRPEAFARFKEEYDRVMGLANEYGRTLHLSQDHTAAAADLARDALVQLRIEVLAE